MVRAVEQAVPVQGEQQRSGGRHANQLMPDAGGETRKRYFSGYWRVAERTVYLAANNVKRTVDY